MDSSKPKIDVYEIVTNRIIELLDQGTIPWQKPWTEEGIPMNLLSKRPYRGINLWLLLSLNYVRNLFLTWDQLKKIGGSVKQGEHGHVVVYWRTIKNGDTIKGEEKKDVPLLRYYKVFNVEQCTDIPEGQVMPLVHKKLNPIIECESIVSQMPQCPPITFKENKAYYDPIGDCINIPKRKAFKSSEGYYSTLFHELVHSTGSEKRLNRKTITEMAEFGSEMYSMEELVAEMGACYLLSSARVTHREIKNSVAYIQGWLSKLKNDKRFMVQASGHAQRAVDFIINQPAPSIEGTEEVLQPDAITES